MDNLLLVVVIVVSVAHFGGIALLARRDHRVSPSAPAPSPYSSLTDLLDLLDRIDAQAERRDATIATTVATVAESVGKAVSVAQAPPPAPGPTVDDLRHAMERATTTLDPVDDRDPTDVTVPVVDRPDVAMGGLFGPGGWPAGSDAQWIDPSDLPADLRGFTGLVDGYGPDGQPVLEEG